VANHLRTHRLDFVPQNIRPAVRKIATDPNLPGNYRLAWNRSVRSRVQELTAAQAYQGDYRKAVSSLMEDCQESSTILVDTLMVLWTRIQEGKGMQWKKALLALQILRHLLLNGPINAIPEVMDGFASIRILRSYTDTLRAQNSKLVRDVATEIYSLMVDLPVLFTRRRELMNRRRLAKDSAPSPLRKETRMIKGINQFRDIHKALRPAGAAVAPAPTPSVDLLSLSEVGSASLPPVAATNTLGVAGSGHQLPVSAPSSGNYSDDSLALSFGPSPSPQVTTDSSAGSKEPTKPDPFSMQAMTNATPKVEQPSTNNDNPFSQLTMSQQPTAQSTPTPAAFVTTSNAPVYAPSQPAFQQKFQPQAMLNASNATQLSQTTAQPMPMATIPSSVAMQQHQSQTSMKVPTMNQFPMPLHPAQVGNYHHPPTQHQQAVGTVAPAFAQKGFQSNPSMPSQMFSRGMSHPTQGNSFGAPPSRQAMVQGAHQAQQGASQVPAKPKNVHANAQNM